MPDAPTSSLLDRLNPAQREAAAHFEGPALVVAGAGSGKCLGVDTPVLRYDGTVIPVQDVRPGDLLMGPDSKPRRVLNVSRGFGALYRVTPTKGQPWICNDVHILTLKGTNRHKGEVIDLPLNLYLERRARSLRFRMDWKLYRTGIEFPAASQPLPVQPYLVGVWLGDGDTKDASFTSKDPEILDYLEQVAPTYGARAVVFNERSGGLKRLRFRMGGRGEAGRHTPSLARQTFLKLCRDELGRKTIPQAYLTASRAERLELLAGLIDTDGHLSKCNLEITTKHAHMADQIAFLCRSLGLAAYISCKAVQLPSMSAPRTYYRLSVSGDLSVIPCLLPRKRATARRQIKDVCVTGFSVDSVGDGVYYGFTLDGDGRFLLGDFTVTHNTRTVVHRIGHLMEAHGVYPTEILAVTFTNKAAGEMKSRVVDLVGPQADQLWVSTFHSAGVRILRVYGEFVGLKSGFVIYDDSDQLDVLKTVLESIPSAGEVNPRYLRAVIDRAKSNLWTPEDLAREGEDWMAGMPREVAVEGYKRYQSAMRRANAIDFGDLLVLTVQLFRDYPQVLDKVQQRAVFIHVDEYQDTNKAQYEFSRLLAEKYRNLLVVGDPDQCLPSETLIRTARGCIPIEDVREGDQVFGTGASGTLTPSRVTHVKNGHYTGSLRVVQAGGRRLRGTPHHVVPARMMLERDLHYVYLMYRADRGYRVGLTKSVRSNDMGFEDFGFRVRMNQEHADKLWILRVVDSRAEAAYWEAFYAARYNLPTQLFHGVGRGLTMDDSLLQKLFRELNTSSGAARLINDLELHPEFPHYRPQNGARRQSLNLVMFQDFRNGPVGYHRIQWSSNREDVAQKLLEAGFPVRGNGKDRGDYRIEMSRKTYPDALEIARQIAAAGGMEIQRRAQIGGQMYAFTPLAHLHPGMRVLIEQGGTLEEASVESVEQEAYDGPVFDLEVEPTHTYLANGMLVHNSIYRFRGADIQNILDFQHDYRDAVIYRLEENYRSNARILSIANKVIEQNTERLEKVLRPIKPEGEPVRLYRAPDHRAEADFVANRIEHLRGTGVSLNKIAVLYRTNAQSRALEERFLRSQIPLKIVGGVSFYERQEIKDMLSLARLAINPDDDVSLKRAIKRPKRGIGDSSVTKLEDWARANRVSLFTAFGKADEILERGGKNAQEFHKLMVELGEYASEHTAEEFLKLAMDASGYVDMLKAELKTGSKAEAEARLENLNELVNAAAEWDKENSGTIEAYLDDAALLSSVDDARTKRENRGEPEEAVTFMTMHNAKGLEFEDVFIVGLEEGLLPHRSSIVEPGGIEEERRLFYVAITRAMERLTMTLADSRQVYGKTMPSERSRFLEDIPSDLIVPVNLFNQPLESEGARGHGLEPAGVDAHRVAPHIQAELERAGGVVTVLKGGEKVKHPKFGLGKVLGVTGAGERQEAMIAFEAGVGTKKLLVKYANLVFAS